MSESSGVQTPKNENIFSNASLPTDSSEAEVTQENTSQASSSEPEVTSETTPSEHKATAHALEEEVTFAELGLPDQLLQAVTDMGYETPSPIQEKTIPYLLEGRDVVGVAQTGTGKTAAFGLPLLTHIDPSNTNVQALVLAPTRELAMQSAEAIQSFATQTRVDVLAVYGGSPYGPQLRALEQGVQVVVGTPGRIMDLIDRGALDLHNVTYFVLDEADEMLRMGFAEDVEKIASDLPEERISALFSATMPPFIRKVAQSHMKDPVEISITPQASTVDTVTQEYAVVPSRRKIGALARVLAVSDAEAAIVFVRTRATAEDLAIELGARGVATAALSGDVPQKDRERLVARLKDGTLDVLVATDVAARGLDVERIGLVVNFDVPRESDTYVHRIGRTGRAGREGRSLTFVTPKEISRLRRIARVTKSDMKEIDLPTPAEVSKLRAEKLVDQARARFELGRLDVYRAVLARFLEENRAAEKPHVTLTLDSVLAHDAESDAESETSEKTEGTEENTSVSSHNDDEFRVDALTTTDAEHSHGVEKPRTPMTVEELLLALLALGVRDPGPSGDTPDPIVDEDSSQTVKNARRAKGGQTSIPGATRYRIEVGHKDRVKPGAIVGALTGEGGLRGSDLGHIDIFPTFSLVEIGVTLSPEARRRISEAEVSGRALRISEDRGPGGSAAVAAASRRSGFRGGKGKSSGRGTKLGRKHGGSSAGGRGAHGKDKGRGGKRGWRK